MSTAACSNTLRYVPAGCRHLPDPTAPTPTRPDFATTQGLRRLLNRLAAAGADAWRTDGEVEALMGFVANRYAALARKHHQQPADAAAAAFEVLRADATRTAEDPWAIVTIAVRLALAAEQRANELLTSPARARRTGYTDTHDISRLSDHHTDLADHHHALHHHDEPLIGLGDPDPVEDSCNDTTGRDVGPEATVVSEPSVIDQAVELLRFCGWPPAQADVVVAFICSRLVDTGERPAAYELLRRDKHARGRFDLPHHCWIALLRATLGNPASHGAAQQGILARLVVGDTLEDLQADDELISLLASNRPTTGLLAVTA
jgi:hypothetical protein